MMSEKRFQPGTAAPRDPGTGSFRLPPRQNRFEMTREYWRARFLERFPAKPRGSGQDEESQARLIERFHLDADERCLYITYYGQRYAVDRTDGTIVLADDPGAALPFGPQMSIYHLFCYSRPGAMNSGRFVPFRQVKGASPYAPAFERSIAEGLARPFDGRLEALRRASGRLNGEPVPQGDVGCIFHAFECMPVMMVFWDGDEEFPAQANLLFDANITDFTHEETVCCVADDLMRRLRELADVKAGP